jgi:hypothetical protein
MASAPWRPMHPWARMALGAAPFLAPPHDPSAEFAMNRTLVRSSLLLAGCCTSVLLQASPGAQSCPRAWEPTFGGRPGLSGPVLAMTTFDAGGGPELVVGGTFQFAGGTQASTAWDRRRARP